VSKYKISIVVKGFLRVYIVNYGFRDLIYLVGILFLINNVWLEYYIILSLLLIIANHIRFYNYYNRMILTSRYFNYPYIFIYPLMHFILDFLISCLILLLIMPDLISVVMWLLLSSFIVNLLRSLL